MLLMSLDKVEKEKDELGDSNSQHQGHRRILTNAPRRRGGQTALMERSGRLGGCGGMEGVHGVMRKPYGRGQDLRAAGGGRGPASKSSPPPCPVFLVLVLFLMTQ